MTQAPLATSPASARPAPVPAPGLQLGEAGIHTASFTGAPASTTLQMEDFHPSLTPTERGLVARLRDAFSHLPHVASVLEAYIADKAHPMGIVSYLKNPDTSEVVIEHLQEMTSSPPVSRDAFQVIVSASPLASNDAEFSLHEGQPKDRLLRARLLEQDPVLYATTDAPSPEQMDRLKGHARNLRNNVLEHLRADLQDVVSGLPAQDGFPALAARAKSAEGIVDKIHRMRVGNDGKAPRPEYCLADVPDAVGGRITLSNPDQLDVVKQRIEEKYGKENISQKDDFYSNPNKKLRPYRCITYTVTVEGVPCEIQVTTLRSSLAADLVHNTAYKPLHPQLPHSTIQYLLDLQHTVTASEHEVLGSSLSTAEVPSTLSLPPWPGQDASTVQTGDGFWQISGMSGSASSNDPKWRPS